MEAGAPSVGSFLAHIRVTGALAVRGEQISDRQIFNGYQELDELGRGAFSRVVLCERRGGSAHRARRYATLESLHPRYEHRDVMWRSFTLGRDAQSDVRLVEECAAPRHCAIDFEACDGGQELAYLTDLGGSSGGASGTFCNRVKLR